MAIQYSFGTGRFYGKGQKQWQPRRVEYPGSMALRVDDLYLEEEPEGLVPAAIWGTSLCSGERVFMRLTTEEEELEDYGRGVLPTRRSVDALCEYCPTLYKAAHLAPERRPVLRCDRVRVCRLASGEPALHVRYDDLEDAPWTAMRCSWITPYGPYLSSEGEQINPREHMETKRYSTVNLSLHGGRNGGPNYYGIYTDALRKAVAAGETSMGRVCAAAAESIVTAWEQERERNPDTRVGTMSLTTWYPEESFRFDLEDRQHIGRRSLVTWLSDDVFAPRVLDKASGQYFPGSVSPECVLRFLNAKGEVCGVYRVRSNIFNFLPEWAERAGRQEEKGFWFTPQGRAAFVLEEMVLGLDRDFMERHGIDTVDILPGRVYRMEKSVLAPEPAPETETGTGQAGGGIARGDRYRMRNMIWLGLMHGHNPLGEPRQNLGCAQAFVPRTAADYVLSWYSLYDGSPYHNACLLMPAGEHLDPSPAYAAELKHEQGCLANISLCPNLQPGADKPAHQTAHQPADQSGQQYGRSPAEQTAGRAFTAVRSPEIREALADSTVSDTQALPEDMAVFATGPGSQAGVRQSAGGQTGMGQANTQADSLADDEDVDVPSFLR